MFSMHASMVTSRGVHLLSQHVHKSAGNLTIFGAAHTTVVKYVINKRKLHSVDLILKESRSD